MYLDRSVFEKASDQYDPDNSISVRGWLTRVRVVC